MSSTKAVLGMPFSGSLYAFFENELYPERGAGALLKNPYYISVFGATYKSFTDVALTMAVVYDEVLIVPADNAVPGHVAYLDDGKYNNIDLGIKYDWKDYQLIQKEVEERLPKYIEDPFIAKALRKLPQWEKAKTLSDTKYEISVSDRERCPIVCSRGRKVLIEHVRKIDSQESGAATYNSQDFVGNYIDIYGLMFTPPKIEKMAEVKDDKNVRAYARDFVRVMENFSAGQKTKDEFSLLMRQAMLNESIAAKASGIYEASANVFGALGVLPVVGTPFSVGGFAASALSKTAASIESRNRWYELAPEIRRVTEREEMLRKLAKMEAET